MARLACADWAEPCDIAYWDFMEHDRCGNWVVVRYSWRECKRNLNFEWRSIFIHTNHLQHREIYILFTTLVVFLRQVKQGSEITSLLLNFVNHVQFSESHRDHLRYRLFWLYSYHTQDLQVDEIPQILAYHWLTRYIRPACGVRLSSCSSGIHNTRSARFVFYASFSGTSAIMKLYLYCENSRSVLQDWA